MAGDRDWREALHDYLPRDWVFTIALVVFVAVLVWFGRQIYDFALPSASTVTVPSFVGQSLTDAEDEISRLKLSSTVVAHTMSDRYPKDAIIMQRPDAGDQVRQGRQVSFVISDGVILRQMPDLRYQSMREVSLDLSRSHLQLGKVTYVKSDFVPGNHVIAQDPAPLATVHEGDVVSVTVSKGGQATLAVPHFVGMTIDRVRDLARKSGIKLGQIVWTPLGKHGPAHGVVARQIPAPGTKIASYDPVSVQVSAGPNESGYLIRQVHVLASIPVSGETSDDRQLDVRLQVTDATGRYDLYHAYAEPGQKLDFTVTAVGTSAVDLYVNGSLVGESVLGTEPARVYDEKASAVPSPNRT